MNQKSGETKKKLRGGYYTPLPIAQYLTDWVLKNNPKSILEPSCGDGNFLKAISKSKYSTGNKYEIDGVELFEEEAEKAQKVAQNINKSNIKIHNGDFFEWIINGHKDTKWDGIIGNPPYIRYQYFDKTQREIASNLFKKANIKFSKRTNAWVPFLIAAVQHLSPGGRLAMIIPAEILHIQHAQGLRLLLEQEMDSISLVALKEIVFEKTLQGTILILAQKRSDRDFIPLLYDGNQLVLGEENKSDFNIIDINGIKDLPIHKDLNCKKIKLKDFQGEWMQALLEPNELSLIRKINKNSNMHPFKNYATVNIGIVTGANKYFVVDRETLQQYELQEFSHPMLAKSNLINGISYKENDHIQNAKEGKSVFLLHFPDKPLSYFSEEVQEYIRKGEDASLHERYKCRIRDPWYRVPYVYKSELALLKRCHIYPRLIVNKLGAYSTDTAYRIKLHDKYQGMAKSLSLCFLNSFSFIHSEIFGRHYGGGVLELVPSEIEKIPIPLYEFKDNELFRKVDSYVREEAPMKKIRSTVDKFVLNQKMGLNETEINILQNVHDKLIKRRHRV